MHVLSILAGELKANVDISATERMIEGGVDVFGEVTDCGGYTGSQPGFSFGPNDVRRVVLSSRGVTRAGRWVGSCEN